MVSIPVVYNINDSSSNNNNKKQILAPISAVPVQAVPTRNYSSFKHYPSAIKRYCGNIKCKICKKLKLPIQHNNSLNTNNSINNGNNYEV